MNSSERTEWVIAGPSPSSTYPMRKNAAGEGSRVGCVQRGNSFPALLLYRDGGGRAAVPSRGG